MNQLIWRYWPKTSAQHDALDEKRRRDAEGNQIGEGIEFAAKRAFHAAHARDAAVEQIKNAREQNERERELDLPQNNCRAHRIGIHDFGQRHEAAKQISSREQVRQKINLQLLRPDRRAAVFGKSGCVHVIEGGNHGFAADDFVAEIAL